MSQLQSALAHEEQKLLACIHCGLCLEACPTYVVTGNENDGPRGRIYLMRAVAEGRLSNTSTAFETHIDRCLGCRACEQACPAGVEYGQLLEASRAELVQTRAKSGIVDKGLRFALKYIWAYPNRLKLFFSMSRLFRDLGLANLLVKSKLPALISKQAEFAVTLLDSSRPTRGLEDKKGLNYKPKQSGLMAESVLLFDGCVGEGLFARINRATERVLRANNFGTSSPATQVCCGALHAHAGDLEGARELARQNIKAFQSDAPVITNAGGCGAMLVTYGHLLADDPQFADAAKLFSARVRDVSQQLQLATKKLNTEGCPDGKVTYDTSCHLLYGQKAGETSKTMLTSAMNGCYVELDGTERCCGAAGIYNLVQPELSQQVFEEKLANIKKTGASMLATGNPGCQMHIAAKSRLAGLDLKVCHPIELIDEAYFKQGIYSESEDGH